MSLQDEVFKTASIDGLTLAKDQEVHDDTVERMRQWLATKRVHFEPVESTLVPYTYNGIEHLGVGPETEFTSVIADHLSGFNTCPLRSLKNKQASQAAVDAGGSPQSDLSEEKVVIFGMGYVFQEGLMGDTEVALWKPYTEDRLGGGYYYSPDAVTLESPHQIKTTRKSPSTKADREITVEAVVTRGPRKGEVYQKATGTPDPTWSVEKGILEKFTFYWRYELQSMYLFNRSQSYITFWWINSGDQMTFKLTAEQDKINEEGAALEGRIRFQREHQEAGTLPPPDSRLEPRDCRAFGEACPFLSEDPCMSRVPLLDMMAGAVVDDEPA